MDKNSNILIINGPNLNMLGMREKSHYGDFKLDDIENDLNEIASSHAVSLIHFQSNSEEAIINKIHEFYINQGNKIIINPAAFTHTSVAIRDALLCNENACIIEVHISNIHKRETFRKNSYFSDIAMAVIAGAGRDGYKFAFNLLLNR